MTMQSLYKLPFLPFFTPCALRFFCSQISLFLYTYLIPREFWLKFLVCVVSFCVAWWMVVSWAVSEWGNVYTRELVLVSTFELLSQFSPPPPIFKINVCIHICTYYMRIYFFVKVEQGHRRKKLLLQQRTGAFDIGWRNNFQSCWLLFLKLYTKIAYI